MSTKFSRHFTGPLFLCVSTINHTVSNWSNYSRPNLYYRPWAQIYGLVRKEEHKIPDAVVTTNKLVDPTATVISLSEDLVYLDQRICTSNNVQITILNTFTINTPAAVYRNHRIKGNGRRKKNEKEYVYNYSWWARVIFLRRTMRP